MRILFYSIPPFSDCDFPLVRALRQAGHEVFFILRIAPFMKSATILNIDEMDKRNQVLPASSYPELTQWSDFIDIDKTFVSNDPVGKTGFKSFSLFLEDMRLAQRIKADVICHIGFPFFFHFFMLWKNKKRSVCVVHDPLPHSGEESFKDRLKRRLLPMTCGKFVLLSRHQLDSFSKKYRISSRRIFLASLGPYDCYRQLKSGRGIKGRYILFFGRLSPYKGIDCLLDAFHMIRPGYPDLQLVIAGAGPVCFDPVKIEGDSGVLFLHRYLEISEMADYVSQCQFVVCPYTDATQSGVIQTAFALGAPVVATDVGNFADVIEDGVTGKIVPPENSAALSGAFDYLLSNESVLSGMRENVSRMTDEGALSWRAIADEYVRAFKA